MYNLRYHLASLVAVFIALAVGLLLGTVVAERGMLDDQGVALVQGLQTRFDEISAENEELEAGLERDRAFVADAVGPLIAGRLVGQRVVIIAPAGQVEALAVARETAQSAGAEVSTVTLASPALGMESAEPEGLAGFLHGRDVEIAPAGAPLVEQIAELLTAEWRAGDERPLTEFLVTSGLVSLESASGTGTVDAVVIAGGTSGPVDPLGLELAKRYITAGGRSVGADLTFVEDGVAAVFDAEGIPAVDHLAIPQGRYSFVAVLAGLANGYYGTGDGVDAYYAPIAP
ncbi:MAG: copper transporter [Coriobacteriia bacterium]|nr:copper transporter [Coriobacteriia bacterium]MBN2840623.1 copper transporter [Coriobacteriia bacterium]